jgi:hypothetical protein
MKFKWAFYSALFASSIASANICDVEMAKKYVAGLELVAAGISNGRIETGDRVNGKTITRSDINVVSADSAYLVTVTNTAENGFNYGNYSKYLVTLKQIGSACYPASIVFVGNSRNSGK